MDAFRAQLQDALGGVYTLERELGGGGMSRVFLAEERALGRRVVIKVLAPELAAGVSAERFTREIRLTAKLQHPQIVPVHAAGTAAGLPYYVMPYVEGESLRDHLRRTGPMPIGVVVGILRDVAKALVFAHERGVVHRDIKPGNILLSGESATVADFGIGKALSASSTLGDTSDSLTGLGMAVGTPAYVAPEQAAGDGNTDHRADIYAVGVLAYEMLTGVSPFARGTPRETIAAVMSAVPAPVRVVRPEAPAWLAILIAGCMEKDPARRPQASSELVTALDGTTTPTGFAAPSARRFRRVATAAGVLGLVVLVARVARDRATGASGADTRADRSVAVLPCTNVGGDTAAEYFVDGITGELMGRLARVPGLRVTPRASVVSLRGRGLEPAEIGERLKVGTIVECTIRRLGPNVRVTADLVDVKAERTLWAGTFEGALQGVIAVQDTIARAVSSALSLRLADAVSATRTVSDTATYLLYLKGRFLWNQRTPLSMHRGIQLLETALARDSMFAPAWAELANAYSLAPAFSDEPSAVSAPRARAAANRAIALDSTLAQAQVSLGIINTFYDWDFVGALRRFDVAARLNPGDANTALYRTWALVGLGRMDEALASIREARRLDPFAQIINTRVASVLIEMRRYPEAEQEARRAVELDSSNVLARFELGHSLVLQRRFDEGFAAMPRNAMEMSALQAGTQLAKLALDYALAGRRSEALECRRRLEERSRTAYVSPLALGGAAAATGDTDVALALVERGVRDRVLYTVFLATEPEWALLHAQPRFRAVLAKVGLRAPP